MHHPNDEVSNDVIQRTFHYFSRETEIYWDMLVTQVESEDLYNTEKEVMNTMEQYTERSKQMAKELQREIDSYQVENSITFVTLQYGYLDRLFEYNKASYERINFHGDELLRIDETLDILLKLENTTTSKKKYDNLKVLLFNLKAFALSDLERAEEASIIYKLALDIDPLYVCGYYNLGLTYCDMQRYEEAKEQFTIAVGLDPEDALSYRELALIHDSMCLFREALALYKQAIQLKSDDASLYYDRGVTNMNTYMLDEAIKDLTYAIELDNEFIYAYIVRGQVYDRSNQFDLAIADLTQAINLNPLFSQSYLVRGMVYCNNNILDTAYSDYTKALELDDGTNVPTIYIRRATYYCGKHKHIHALSDASKATALAVKETDVKLIYEKILSDVRLWSADVLFDISDAVEHYLQ
jgi:tetratricopeptide (TPR) repeat protein